MESEIPSKTVPNSGGRDQSDFARLRHARERHEGFAVGRFLQPAPMLFSRDGHNVFLGDMYRGHTAFLLCSGPSLNTHDLSRLNARGVLTMALNNAATVYRPQLWCCVDDPGNFSDAIWFDPGIQKFVPLCHMEKTFMVRDDNEELIPSQERVGDMPAVFGYRRNEAFNADQWLFEDTFNWGNHSNRKDADGHKGSRSVMYVALRLLFYLGVRRVNLLGCDFKMEIGKQNYAFDQDRSRGSVRGNNSSYRILNTRLERLKPHFEREGFQVRNCTPNSGLTVFPHVPFEEAVEEARSLIPSRIITTGMYDRQQREKDAKEAEQEALKQAKVKKPSKTVGEILDDLTLLIAVDEDRAHQLKYTWKTWMRNRPQFRNLPVIVIHDSRFEPKGSVLQPLFDHPRIRFVRWTMEDAESQRERMLTAFVRVAATEVKTAWYLKLDCDVVAAPHDHWLEPNWFEADGDGRLPAFIASPWGYTKPAGAIARLDNWGDTVPELRETARLDLPFDAKGSRVRHPRIASWCFYGNTEWTRKVSALSQGRLPIPSHDTYLFYCAARRRDHFVRSGMSKCGWETISNFRRMKRRCQDLLGDELPTALPSPTSVATPTNDDARQGVLYFLSGNQHGARLLVSIASLRRHYDGPVTVLSTDDRAHQLCRQIAQDRRLDLAHREIPDAATNGRKKPSYLFKTRLHEYSPYENTIYLDCDTLVKGDLSEMFQFPDASHIIVTQFCDWKTRGRTISKRIRSWEDTHPELIEPALDFGPALNTGSFAFTRSTRIFERWSQVADQGQHHFIPDELAMQLLVPHYPHVVLDGRYNCSPRYGDAHDPDVRIVHFHGNRHLRRDGRAAEGDLWAAEFRDALANNAGNIAAWLPAGDRRLKRFHRRNGLLYQTNVAKLD